jgi:outer membrane protein assembly factor BamB
VVEARSESGADALRLGTAGSPVLHQGRIYVVNDNDDQSYIEALDKKTGAEIWRVERAEATNWATPYIWEHDGKAEIVTPGPRRFAPTTWTGNCCGSSAGCPASPS